MQHARRKTVTGAAALLAAGALSTALAVPAAAAGTFTVQAGSAASGASATFTGTAGTITLKDTSTGTTLTCKSGTAKGSATVGTGLAGTGIAKVDGASSTFSSCSGPLGLTFTTTGAGTWSLDAATSANGVTTGSLSGIQASIKNSGGVACSFSAAGSVPGSFTNSTQTLATSASGADVTISNVSGCAGLVKSGDKASVEASYTIAPDDAANGPVSITSP